jgi:serine/threonine-protein kinase HipA
MGIKSRPFSGYTREVLTLLGQQIRVGRKQRRWSAQELATRAGIARDTLQHIEKGDAGCAIGLVFEVAALVGVPLFAVDQPALARERSHADAKLALLPKAIRSKGAKASKSTTKRLSEVFVWAWLPGAVQPVVAGKLVSNASGNVDTVHFYYGRTYSALQDALPLYEPELPLRAGRLPLLGELTMPGCLRDAAPAGWGKRVLLNHLLGSKGARGAGSAQLDDLSLLLQSGSERIGGFDFQASATEYEPRIGGNATLAELVNSVERVEKGMPLSDEADSALIYRSAIGGVRPKAFLGDATNKYIAKFPSRDDDYNVVKAEFLAMRLAQVVGLQTAAVKLAKAAGKDVLLVERFDRVHVSNQAVNQPAVQATSGWQRRSMVSALTLLALDDSKARYASYELLAEQVRHRFTDVAGTLRELFGRLVFNILCGNTDDHARNHAAFWDGQQLTLTPAFDICPQLRLSDVASQAMAISGGNAASQLATCLQAARHFLLSEAAAVALIEQQMHIMGSQWPSLCEEAELSEVDRAMLWGRAFLNPFAFEELDGAASTLQKLAEDMRQEFSDRKKGMTQLLLV